MQSQEIAKIASAFKAKWGSAFSSQVINIVAYGSGAFPQTSNPSQTAQKTLDFLVEVRHPHHFHDSLKKSSPEDYSIMGGLINWANQSIFPMHSGHTTLANRKIKYSVIGKADFRNDLQTWNYLSFAGRLHKPIMPILPLSEGLSEQVDRNRLKATATALLLYGGKGRHLNLDLFFSKVCQISYMGDVRFSVGAQNPAKIANIVHNNYQRFREIYLPNLQFLMNKMPKQLYTQGDLLSFLLTGKSLAVLLPLLPPEILNKVDEQYTHPTEGKDYDIVKRVLIGGAPELSKIIQDKIISINRASSTKMALQNAVTGSPLTNLSYLWAKWQKGRGK